MHRKRSRMRRASAKAVLSISAHRLPNPHDKQMGSVMIEENSEDQESTFASHTAQSADKLSK